MAYIDTPRTDVNTTYLSNSNDLENLSIENSLLSPLKGKNGFVSQMRNNRGINLKTPRARVPFSDRRNLPGVPGRAEFTPLLKSVARKNLERNGKLSGGPETPAFLKAGYKGGNTPALPRADVSGAYGGDFFSSSILEEEDETPIPKAVSSSAQSTPLAVLPKRDPAGVLADQGNVMTLREQENIIDKIEKDNFGLKLKIHFLEEALRKAGPGYNEIAMKENTDLKVDKVTIQRELGRMRKALQQAQVDMETYRRHLEDVQEKAKRKHSDEKLLRELEQSKSDVATKDTEIRRLQQKLETIGGQSAEMDKLRGEIEDLEVDLREKERIIDEHEDEIEQLKDQVSKDSEELDEVYAELEASKQICDELKSNQSDLEKQCARREKAEEELEEALRSKRKAEEDLEELQDEMSNKSINTKGLNRQLEEKASKVQDDLSALRETCSRLEEDSSNKSAEVKELRDQLQDAEQEASVREQKLQDQNGLLCDQGAAIVKKCESLTEQTQQAIKDLQTKSEEKDLLHSRHDALTVESQTLQRDLTKARAKIEELEESLEDERQHAADNDRQLRSEAKQEFDRLSEAIDSLHRELDDKDSQYNADLDQWEGEKRNLQIHKEKAEEQAAGLQRTISKLQETEGTLSGRESQLQKALESEKQRYKSEEAVLERQLQDLHSEIEDKRHIIEACRIDLSQAKEDLRISQRNNVELDEKAQALEDEVNVLQSNLDDEAEALRSELAKSKEALANAEDQREIQRQHETINELKQNLTDVEQQLNQAKLEESSLQDKLAATNLEMRKHQASSAEVEAERDEVRSQLQQMQNQMDDTFKLDQEKLELRTAKLRSESDNGRLREERKTLLDRNAAIENELEQEIARTASEEGLLRAEIAELQKKLSTARSARDRELISAKQQVQRLERQIEELESPVVPNIEDRDEATELSVVQKDLMAARKKEAELLQRENTQKETIRELKQKVSNLERQNHELEVARLTISSPQSSVGGSARKNELVGVRQQLSVAQQQLKDARVKSREEIKMLQGRLIESEREVHENIIGFEQQQEHLENQIARDRQEHEALVSKYNASAQTITRLRTRIASLEQDIQVHRHSTTTDATTAEERKDLHDMLKDAKLTAEDLQVQLKARDKQLASTISHEDGLRNELKRVREGRALQADKAVALSSELENLQSRYEHAVEKFTQQQQTWEEERRTMSSRVRFPNNSVSSLHVSNEVQLAQRHAAELRGLAKQIQWLRAKLNREEGFRSDLIYEKKYMKLEIEMFEACNRINLNQLAEMGLEQPQSSPRLRLADSVRAKAGQRTTKVPSLRVIGLAVIAGCRMRKMSEDWAEQKKIKEALVKKMHAMMQSQGKKGKKPSGDR